MQKRYNRLPTTELLIIHLSAVSLVRAIFIRVYMLLVKANNQCLPDELTYVIVKCLRITKISSLFLAFIVECIYDLKEESIKEKKTFLNFLLKRRKWSNCIFLVDNRRLFIIVYISYKNYDNKIGKNVFATTVCIKGISVYNSCDTWIKNIQLLE